MKAGELEKRNGFQLALIGIQVSLLSQNALAKYYAIIFNCNFIGYEDYVEPWLGTNQFWKNHVTGKTVKVECATLEENKYHCDSNPCVNGKCIGVISDFHCICQANWKGKTCPC